MSFDIDNLELILMFENESISYVLCHKINLDSIIDLETRALARKAKEGINNLLEHLNSIVSEEEKEKYRKEWG